MTTTTIFTWGYYGWGNHTPQLINAVDAVEKSQDFEPPLFLDTRIRRTVRAKGFQGDAFEKLLGPSRHCWMKSLGNKFILTHTGPEIQIADPSAANKLLDIAMDAGQRKQRVLFFCSCQWPRCEGVNPCHRTTVAKLVLNVAKKRGVPVEIVEWPGGQPGFISLDVTPSVFTAIKRGRVSIPLNNDLNLAELAGLPWGSIATLHSGHQQQLQLVGPAIRQPHQWVLPILKTLITPDSQLPDYEKEAARIRRDFGLEAASS